MPNDIDHSIDATVPRMAARLEQLIAALPAEFKVREDQMPARMRADNASAKAKIGRIYAFMDEFSRRRAPYVACRAGCSSCCHMNVQISNLEAARIEAGSGRRAKLVPASIRRADNHFAGKACPFLKDSACSIYAHRPYVCRNHASFDVDAYWCDTSRMEKAPVPKLELSGVKEAMLDVLEATPRPVLADIRDFFPPAS